MESDTKSLNKRRPSIDLEDLPNGSTYSFKRQKNETHSISRREGGIRHGDEPVRLLKVILVEGEPIWLVEWEEKRGKGGEKWMIEESYERESSLREWDSSRFSNLKSLFTN